MSSITAPIASYANAFANSTGSGATGGSSSNTTTTVASDPLANEATFLKLLVSQLKNQNPASPMDGTTFVTQLAQFSDLEQNLAMRNDLDSINAKYTATAVSPTGGSGSQPASKS